MKQGRAEKSRKEQKRADAGLGIRDTSRKRKIKVANCICEIDMNPKSDNEKIEIQHLNTERARKTGIDFAQFLISNYKWPVDG